MQQSRDHILSGAAIVLALLLFALAGLIGGPGNLHDVAAIHSLAAERAANIGLTGRAIVITQLGGAPGMMVILAIAIASLALARRRRDALSLGAIVLGGRIAIELLKIAINRPRPVFTPYPVEIASLSFPSGHAGNSMITFLAIALVAVPRPWRGSAIVLAVVLSVAIGATRPLLGVHWPSDVIGGWAFGIAWVVAMVALLGRWRGAAKQ